MVSQDLGPFVIDSENGSINIHSGRTINITSDDTICIKAANGVRIIDDKSIEFKVDKSSQSMTKDKIVLTQGGHDEIADFSCLGYSSSLTLDGIFGTKLQGSDVDIVSSHSATMSDKYGSKVKIASGRIYLLSLAGLGLSTATKNAYVNKLVDLAIQSSDGVLKNTLYNHNDIYSLGSAGFDLIKDIKTGIYAGMEASKAKGGLNKFSEFWKKFNAITNDYQRFAYGNHKKSYMFNQLLIIIKSITLIAKIVFAYVKKIYIGLDTPINEKMKLTDRIFKYIIDSTELLMELNALLFLVSIKENSALLVERDCIWLNTSKALTKAASIESVVSSIDIDKLMRNDNVPNDNQPLIQ